MAMECTTGGGAVGGSGGDEPSGSNPDQKRYHRHTAEQIQLLEAKFNESPHADENTRSQLSRELGLSARQIKFWFQNRRTQIKTKSEVAENCLLRTENDKIRSENTAFKEALKNAICPTCGGPPVAHDHVLEEQRLRLQNAQLREELDRVTRMTSKYIGKPLSLYTPPPVHPRHIPMGAYAGGTGTQDRIITMASGGPALDPDLIITAGIRALPSICPVEPLQLTAMDKSLMADYASRAMDELLRLCHAKEPLWTKCPADGRDVLDLDIYERIFPRSNASLDNPKLWIEASRSTGDVMMNSLQLIDMFTDTAKWSDLFPTIVSKARTIEVISSTMFGIQSDSLRLMYEELQVASPLVPIRQFVCIRFCQQIDQNTWAVVDVSYDLPKVDGSQCHSRRRPSGCLIRSMPDGCSKVTWVEHLEIEEKTAVHLLYRDLIYSGLAFGAERWLSCLQRSCERVASQRVIDSSTRELGGVIDLSDEGKKNVMKLAQKMVNSFCTNMSPCSSHLWSFVSSFDDFEVHTTLYKSPDPGQTNAMILAAAATIWLPLSPQWVFDFLRDGRNRSQWDVLAIANHSPLQEVVHIASGAHPGNCISVLKAENTSQTNILILQESCTDSSGSLVVYCPVDLPVINLAMRGEDQVYIPLLPSGFAITADGRTNSKGASTSVGAATGSLVTLLLQVVVSSLPWKKLGPESMATINNLMGRSVRQIKAAMKCT